jgi:hypothetical protein
MKAHRKQLLATLGLVLGFAFGCSADDPSSPTAPPVVPVPPAAGINVTVTTSTSTLDVATNSFATLTVRATRADNGQPVPNLTPGRITTTLGTFGSVGGPQELDIELVGGQATVILFPGATVGTASVRAAVSTGVAFTSVTVREPGLPDTFFLGSVSPNTGSPQGGETISINGGGFSDPLRVTINGIGAVIQSASGTQIRVTTPRCVTATCFDTGAVTPVDVSVTSNLNEEGQASDTLVSGFSYVNGGGSVLIPTIFSVTPSSGPNEGGTQVTINGDGFEAPVAVDFGNTGNQVSAQVVSVTRTRVVVLSPPATGIGAPNLNQLVAIRVTNQSSGRTTTAASAFRYGVDVEITSIGPGEGPASGGTIVTIYGRGFDEPVAVTLGQHAQQVLSVSGSEIVVRTVPIAVTNCADVTGPTAVVNIETGDGDSNGPNFTYRIPRPLLFNVSPFGGPQSGNTLVSITGANFGSPMIVEFVIGGTAFGGNVQSSTASSISVRSPAIPNTVLNTETCDDNGNPVPPDPTPDPDGERYLAVSADVRVTDPATGCTATLNGVFSFAPSDTTCRGD